MCTLKKYEAMPLRTPPPPPHLTGWTPKRAVCEGTFVATFLLGSDSLYDHWGF